MNKDFKPVKNSIMHFFNQVKKADTNPPCVDCEYFIRSDIDELFSSVECQHRKAALDICRAEKQGALCFANTIRRKTSEGK